MEPTETVVRQNLLEIVQENSPYHVQYWYPLVQPHTFQTSFLPLSLAQARVIVQYNSLSVRGNNPEKPDERRFLCKKDKEALIKAELGRIEQAIEEGIKSVGVAEGCGAFVRLSSRSPKDTVHKNLFELYTGEVKVLKEEGREENDVTRKIAFTRANVRILRVKSGKEAMQLMLTSSRVHEDLQMTCTLLKGKPDYTVATQIVIRKWENILPEWEMRAFVFGGKLTAISQYYKSTFVPELVQKKKNIEERMIEFWEKNIKTIFMEKGVADYVVDFAVHPNSDKIWIVEINNPPPVAGQGCFIWENEIDMKIIRGELPFEFRILEKAPDDPLQEQRGWLQSEKDKKAKEGRKKLTTSF